MTERTALYRLYDADDQLLYIGIAKDPKVRWQGHAQSTTSPWWTQVSRKTVTWYPSREEADEAETQAIASEGPLRNRAKVARRTTGWGRWGVGAPEINRALAHKDPLSQQVARALRAEIEEGKIPPGGKMPTGRDLFHRFGVTENTCNLALRKLADEGLCYQPRPRSGYVCADPGTEAQPSTHAPLPTPPTDEVPAYRTFRFAVNHPSKGAASIRAKMTDDQWAAFVAAIVKIDEQRNAA